MLFSSSCFSFVLLLSLQKVFLHLLPFCSFWRGSCEYSFLHKFEIEDWCARQMLMYQKLTDQILTDGTSTYQMSTGQMLTDLMSSDQKSDSPHKYSHQRRKETFKIQDFPVLELFFSCLKVWSGTGNSRMSPIELMKAKISRCFFRPKGSMRFNLATWALCQVRKCSNSSAIKGLKQGVDPYKIFNERVW